MNKNEIAALAATIAAENDHDNDMIFDSFADHIGSDDDAYYLIHLRAIGDAPDNELQPRTIAFLALMKHDPLECDYCNTLNTDTF